MSVFVEIIIIYNVYTPILAINTLFAVKNTVIGGLYMPRRGENIYHRKDGRWEGRYIKTRSPIDKTVYGYVYAQSYAEVKQKLIEAKKAFEERKPFSTDLEFNEVATLWIKRKKATVKLSTITLYENKINNYILPAFQSYKVSDISTIMLQSFIENLLCSFYNDRPLSNKTISDILAILKSILRYSEQSGCVLMCNLSVLKMKYESKEIRVLSLSEQYLVNRKLYYANDYTSFGILLSLYTGIRIGELCSLTTRDIDLSLSKLKIWRTLQRIQYKNADGTKTILNFSEPKSKKSVREIPLPDFIMKKLRLLNYADGTFLLSGTFAPIEPRTMENRYNRFMEELNIYGTTFHSLRHTFATRSIESGFEVSSLSSILGHSSVNFTLNRYVHSSFELKVENMKKISFNI